MQTVILFVVLGLGPGTLIAGMALGVVMIHRASGVINFATGVVAAWGAYVFYGLRTSGELWLPPLPLVPHHVSFGPPWATIPALALALASCGALGYLFELVLVRPLRKSSPLAKLLASLGVFLLLQAVLTLRFGSAGQAAPTVLGAGTVSFLGVNIPADRFILTATVIVATVVLTLVYRNTRFGLATRAAAENEDSAELFGVDVDQISMRNVVAAHVLVGGLGVLVAPLTTLDPNTIPDLVIPALAAAVFAGFRSFPLAALGGLVMGVIQSLVTYFETKSWFPTSGGVAVPGVSDLIFFLIVIAVMFVRGAKLPTRAHLAERRLPSAPAPQRVVAPAAVGLMVCCVAFLVLPFDWRQALINSQIGVIACLSFVVVTGFIGQVSLLQLGLGGVTGFVMSNLAVRAGIGFPLAPIIGIAAATALGVSVALSALRIRGVNLAIVTLAGAVALENFGFANTTWGAGANGSPVPSPHIFGLNFGTDASFPINGATQPSPVFGLVCTVAVVAVCVLVAGLRRSSLGHRMLAVRSNERAAAASGINVVGVKLFAFAFSSVLAGIAGALSAYNLRSVSAESFGFFAALTTLSFAYIGGITTVQGAVVAGIGVTAGLAALLSQIIGIPAEYQYLFGGLFLLLIILVKPEGLASNKGMDPPPVLAYRAVKRLTARRAKPVDLSP